MRTIMAKNPHDSFSFSRRYFHWKKKVGEDEEEEEEDSMNTILNFRSKSQSEEKARPEKLSTFPGPVIKPPHKKKLPFVSVSKLRSAFSLSTKNHAHIFSTGHGKKIIGTLFGYRRGHVHFSFQEDFNQKPGFLVELATPTSNLVKEMASGLVRIALECDKNTENSKKGAVKLLEEPIWRTYCNGKKRGFAMRKECGEQEWKVLRAVGPVSMGAGVLPNGNGDGGESDGEFMYMRAKFERVVGSKDSEAFYMMNPDGNGGPELSIYLLRV